MIRLATQFDIPAVVHLGAQFFDASGYGDLVEFNPADFADMLAVLIFDDAGLLIVAEEDGAIAGMIGAGFQPYYFNRAVRGAIEMFWYVVPQARTGTGRDLLVALEREARKAGAVTLTMMTIVGRRDEAIARLYRARGYRELERNFIKVLT